MEIYWMLAASWQDMPTIEQSRKKNNNASDRVSHMLLGQWMGRCEQKID